MIRVFKTGRHSHRTPLSYPALAPLWQDQIVLVERPDEADLYLFAHVLDIAEAPREMVEDWRRRRCPVVLLSEEPFWDTIWGKRPLERLIYVETLHGALPVVQINHQTSDIYRFDRIPYYLLTNHRFATAYRYRFQRNAALSPDMWRADFANRDSRACFMFERRPEPFHDVSWPEGDLIGLCAWRTRLAEAAEGERLGRSWQGGHGRLDLPDWHLDKLVRMDRRTVLMGAVENTHQPDYVTEKVFDAFACGALPLYVASPRHRLHTLGLPGQSWINLFDLTSDKAADKLRHYQPDNAVFEAYAQAQARLAALFSETRFWLDERARLSRAVKEALEQALSGTG